MPTKNTALKKITTEAKAIRKNKPSMSWQSAIKQASKFYNDTVKPTAKKVATKTKRVASATKKGYAVARNTYRRSSVGATRNYEVDTILVEDLFYFMQNEPTVMRNYERSFLPNIATKVGRGVLDKSKLPKLMEYLYKNHQNIISKAYGDYKLNPKEREYLSQLWTDQAIEDLSGNYDQLYSGRTNKYEPIEKFTKGNVIGKVGINVSRAGARTVKTGSGRIGMKTATSKKKAKTVSTAQFLKTGVPVNKGAKPKKPTITDLKKANIQFFEAHRSIGIKEQKVFYSPLLNAYILVQKIDPKKFKFVGVQLYNIPSYFVFQINPKSNKISKSFNSYKTVAEINQKFITEIIN